MKSYIKIILALLLLPIVGAYAFMFVEGWSFFDSLYMAVITVTTVGYQEVHPLTEAGRWVVIIYLIFGLGIFLFGVAQIGEIIVRAELSNIYGRKKMQSSIAKLKGHFIVCGYGRMGEALCKSLEKRGEQFVIIDKEIDRITNLQQAGKHALMGDVTDDRVLSQANVENAKGLAVALSHDADNLYVVMSARLMNSELQILSRASDENAERKMLRAGANRVVSPYKSGAARMAQLLANPHLNDFIEIFDNGGSEVDLAQVTVENDCQYLNKALVDSDFTSKGIVIVGIRKANGELMMPPHKDTLIEIKDTLIAMGKAEAINNLIAET